MNDETKKLFDAPWKAVEIVDTSFPYLHECEIVSNNGKGHMIATEVLRTDANRLSHLPELYDALMVAAYEHCQLCIYKNSESASKMPSPNDMATNGGASFCFQNCPRLKHWKLLKKVRDGE